MGSADTDHQHSRRKAVTQQAASLLSAPTKWTPFLVILHLSHLSVLPCPQSHSSLFPTHCTTLGGSLQVVPVRFG